MQITRNSLMKVKCNLPRCRKGLPFYQTRKYSKMSINFRFQNYEEMCLLYDVILPRHNRFQEARFSQSLDHFFFLKSSFFVCVTRPDGRGVPD